MEHVIKTNRREGDLDEMDTDLIAKQANCVQALLALRETPEYNDLVKAFEELGQTSAARKGVKRITEGRNASAAAGCTLFSLHVLTLDGVMLRVLGFLESGSLASTSITCSRLQELAIQSAQERTKFLQDYRQLNHVIKLLRAKEQINGLYSGPAFVRMPMMGLARRILVTNAGDKEYNGVYFCTWVNANGFEFSKPRSPNKHVDARTLAASDERKFGQEDVEKHRLLRCIITKWWSDKDLFWYMSKEEVKINDLGNPEVEHTYSYWAKLIVKGGDARYPPQSRINCDTLWQPLPSLRSKKHRKPPILELLD